MIKFAVQKRATFSAVNFGKDYWDNTDFWDDPAEGTQDRPIGDSRAKVDTRHNLDIRDILDELEEKGAKLHNGCPLAKHVLR